MLPNGATTYMMIGDPGDELTNGSRPASKRRPVPDWDKMSESERDDHRRRAGLRREFEKQLEVTLAPGETIVTRPWRWVSWEEHWEKADKNEPVSNKPVGVFRELWTEFKFETPGKYRIWAEFIHGPSVTEEEIRHMKLTEQRIQQWLVDHREDVAKSAGRVVSNMVPLEVVP